MVEPRVGREPQVAPRILAEMVDRIVDRFAALGIEDFENLTARVEDRDAAAQRTDHESPVAGADGVVRLFAAQKVVRWQADGADDSALEQKTAVLLTEYQRGILAPGHHGDDLKTPQGLAAGQRSRRLEAV